MSHMNSVRVPASVIVTALLVIILLSSARTTYRLAPAAAHSSSNGGYALAACSAQPVTLTPPPEPRRVCPWPRRPIWAHSRANSQTAAARAAPEDEAPPEH